MNIEFLIPITATKKIKEDVASKKNKEDTITFVDTKRDCSAYNKAIRNSRYSYICIIHPNFKLFGENYIDKIKKEVENTEEPKVVIFSDKFEEHKNNIDTKNSLICFNKDYLTPESKNYKDSILYMRYIASTFKTKKYTAPSYTRLQNVTSEEKDNKTRKPEQKKKEQKKVFSCPSFGEDKITKPSGKFSKIEVRNIQYKGYKPCVAMCLYSRPENLHRMLLALEGQTYDNFEFFIWNNRPDLQEWVDKVVKQYNVETYVIHSEENLGSYARLLIPSYVTTSPIIFTDDDRIPQPDFVEYNLQRYIKFPFAVQSCWAFQVPEDYWGPRRSRITQEDVEVDYCGTGGMVLDKSIFDDKRIYKIPEKFKNIEDLWICYIARKYQQRPLYSMKEKVDVLKDKKDQFTSLASAKTEMYRWMKSNGYKTVSDRLDPNISIVVVTYNRWELSKKCIDSIINNTPRNIYELIVVDNSSTDATIEKLKEYYSQGYIDKLILNDENKQLGEGFNIGWRNVHGNSNYVITLNNDHIVMQGWYYNVMAAFKSNIDFVCATIRGRSFHLKEEIIDKQSNCRFLVLDKHKRVRNRESRLVFSHKEIGEGLVFKTKDIHRLKWYNGWPSRDWPGSYHNVMIENHLKPKKFRGVELGRPAVLTQKNDIHTNGSYYDWLFKQRGKRPPKEDHHFDCIRNKEEYYRWTRYLEEIGWK